MLICILTKKLNQAASANLQYFFFMQNAKLFSNQNICTSAKLIIPENDFYAFVVWKKDQNCYNCVCIKRYVFFGNLMSRNLL